MGVALTASLFIVMSLFGLNSCQGYNNMHRRICTYVFQQCGHNLQSIVADIESEPDLGTACRIARQARTCIGGCANVIVGNPAIVRALDNVIDYVCDETRRDEVQEVWQADCFRDGTIEHHFEDNVQECVQDMQRDVQSLVTTAVLSGNTDPASIMCPVLDSVMECVDGKVEELCGETVVPFINRIFDIVLREMLIDQMPTCFDQVGSVAATHDVMKRAVRYLKQLRK